MHAVVMSGGIIANMVVLMLMLVMMTRRHHLGSAQHEGEMAVDRCEHEARGNQGAKEKRPKDEQRRPLRNTSVPHPGHHVLFGGHH